jgi:hypothetical protein
MYEGKIVKEFNGGAYMPGIFLYFIKEFISHEAEYGTYPFSTQLQEIFIGVVEAGRFRGEMAFIEAEGEFLGEEFE